MIKISHNPKETQKIAGFLFKKLLEFKLDKATTIALEGELGAGKTTFVQGLAKTLGIKAKIKSPTFTLMKKYRLTKRCKLNAISYLYHIDCYRLRDHRDLELLGIKEILNNLENLVLIEWADRVKKILPRKYIKIHIDHINKNTRKISISD